MIDISPYIRWAHTYPSRDGIRLARITMDSVIKIPFEKIGPYIDRIELIESMYIDDGSIKELSYTVNGVIWASDGTYTISAKSIIHYKEGMKEKAETLFKLYL